MKNLDEFIRKEILNEDITGCECPQDTMISIARKTAQATIEAVRPDVKTDLKKNFQFYCGARAMGYDFDTKVEEWMDEDAKK